MVVTYSGLTVTKWMSHTDMVIILMMMPPHICKHIPNGTHHTHVTSLCWIIDHILYTYRNNMNVRAGFCVYTLTRTKVQQRDYIEEGLARASGRDGATAALLVVVIPHGWIKGILAFKLGRIVGSIWVIIGCNDKIQVSDRAFFFIPNDTACFLPNRIYINGICNTVSIWK